jgi:hypothetical protein
MQLADNQLNPNIGTGFSEIHSEWAGLTSHKHSSQKDLRHFQEQVSLRLRLAPVGGPEKRLRPVGANT